MAKYDGYSMDLQGGLDAAWNLLLPDPGVWRQDVATDYGWTVVQLSRDRWSFGVQGYYQHFTWHANDGSLDVHGWVNVFDQAEFFVTSDGLDQAESRAVLDGWFDGMAVGPGQVDGLAPFSSARCWFDPDGYDT